MRAKSAAKLLTMSSICILLILGRLSFSSFTPGSSSGTAWPTESLPADCSSCSISRTNVACSSSNCRSSALTVERSLPRSS